MAVVIEAAMLSTVEGHQEGQIVKYNPELFKKNIKRNAKTIGCTQASL